MKKLSLMVWMAGLLFGVPSFGLTGGLLQFHVSGVGTIQNSNLSLGGQVGWTPYLSLAPALGIKPVLAVNLLSAASGGTFFAPEGQLLLALNPGIVSVEVGGGYQLWLNQNVSSFMYTGQVSLSLLKWFGIFDRLIGAYSYLTAPEVASTQIKLGLGIDI